MFFIIVKIINTESSKIQEGVLLIYKPLYYMEYQSKRLVYKERGVSFVPRWSCGTNRSHPRPYGDRFRKDGSWVKKNRAPAAVKAAAEENMIV